MHLVADISSHGFGHLAQTAPVLNRLAERLPHLQLTVRTALPEAVLRLRLRCRYRHEPRALDFGMLMTDATRVDVAATVAAYAALHDKWQERVEREARALERLKPDLLLANVPYLSLAAAAAVGVPAAAMCSLNWLDLFRDLCAGLHADAARIAAEMEAAYAVAGVFLAPQPSMAMPGVGSVRDIGPVAETGQCRRDELAGTLGISRHRPLVLVSMGGVQYGLSTADWPESPDLFFLVPGPVAGGRGDMAELQGLAMPFPDLLASADAVLTKPGYGSFVEAACCGIAVGYLRRERWPEQDALLAWLQCHARCMEIGEAQLQRGRFFDALHRCIAAPPRPRVQPDGVDTAADILLGLV